MKNLLVISLLSIVATSAFALNKDPAYRDIRKAGSIAKMKIHVVDDLGQNVPDAEISAFMGMNFCLEGCGIKGITDTNGVFVVEGRTCGNEVVIDVAKPGYYSSARKLCFAEKGVGYDVKSGRSLPSFSNKERIDLRIVIKSVIYPVPAFSISPDWSFPANGSDAFALDLSCTTIARNRVVGCGLAFGMSEYKLLYGGQFALLNAYVRDHMYGAQFGATMFAEYGAGAQVGLLTCCDQGDHLAQIGMMNFCNFKTGFMNDNGAPTYTASASVLQVGLANLSDDGGIQVGALNLGAASWQIGIFNFGRGRQIGVFNFSNELKIGVLNYNGHGLTPIIGW